MNCAHETSDFPSATTEWSPETYQQSLAFKANARFPGEEASFRSLFPLTWNIHGSYRLSIYSQYFQPGEMSKLFWRKNYLFLKEKRQNRQEITHCMTEIFCILHGEIPPGCISNSRSENKNSPTEKKCSFSTVDM